MALQHERERRQNQGSSQMFLDYQFLCHITGSHEINLTVTINCNTIKKVKNRNLHVRKSLQHFFMHTLDECWQWSDWSGNSLRNFPEDTHRRSSSEHFGGLNRKRVQGQDRIYLQVILLLNATTNPTNRIVGFRQHQLDIKQAQDYKT